MASNIIAYVGIDNFENMMYLSRILLKLGKRVLVVDHSETQSLTYSIPQPIGVCCEKEIVTCRQVDFTTRAIDQELTENYDDILIAYGFTEPLQDISICSRLVWVTNFYRYNFERRVSLTYSDGMMHDATKSLLIKDAFEIKITPEMVAERMDVQIPSENVYVLYRDEKDYLNGLICHYNGAFRFMDISKQLKRYLMEEARILHPEIDINQRKTAYRRAKKGE